MSFALVIATLGGFFSARDGDFIIAIKIIEALDRGPHIVEVSTTYIGEKPVVVQLGPISEFDLKFESESHKFLLREYLDAIIDTSGMSKDVQFFKGDCKKRKFYLHHLNQDYPIDGVSFLASADWEYWHTDSSGKPTGKPIPLALRKKILLKRVLSTPERLLEIEMRMTKLLQRSYSEESWEECKLLLENTRYIEFCPVVVKMFDATYFPELEWFSLKYLINCTGGVDEAKKYLISELNKPQLTSANAFVAWRHPKFVLPTKQEVHSLLEAHNVWVRGLTAAAFADLLQQKERDSAFSQVREFQNAAPTLDFLALVAKLDSPSYQIREKFTRKLAAMGERIEPMLLHALQNPSSPEVESRLKRVLEEINTTQSLSESYRAIQSLKRMNTPDSINLLKILASSPIALRSTREAIKALEWLEASKLPPKR